jgi:hypothetical protein
MAQINQAMNELEVLHLNKKVVQILEKIPLLIEL